MCKRLILRRYDYFGARYYASDLSVWLSVDPLSDEYPSTSPYMYVAGNPVKYIDPTGMNLDEYVFDSDGNFTGEVVEKKGDDYGVIVNSDGSRTKFSFADPTNDTEALRKGDITKAVLVTNEAIYQALDASGVNKPENQKDKAAYIERESAYDDPNSSGKMDYSSKSIKINGKMERIRSNTLYITNVDGVNIAHNNYNFGNFLWGAGACSLGVPLIFAKFGAHYFTMKKSEGRVDSSDDQYSIELGFKWKLLNE